MKNRDNSKENMRNNKRDNSKENMRNNKRGNWEKKNGTEQSLSKEICFQQ